MRRDQALAHQFVDYIPKKLEPDVVYVSLKYATAIHRCCCGCGEEVVTPLSPTDWKVTFDGESISLDPSIGNWQFPCKSHYWIWRDKAVWAPRWTEVQINAGRVQDQVAKGRFYWNKGISTRIENGVGEQGSEEASRVTRGLWSRLKAWWSQ